MLLGGIFLSPCLTFTPQTQQAQSHCFGSLKKYCLHHYNYIKKTKAVHQHVMSILLERSRPTGRVWHRARVQPFRNPDHLGAAQETLQSPFHLPLFLYELWWFQRSWMCGWLLGITAVSSLYCSGPRTNALPLAVKILVRRAQFWCIVTSTLRWYFYRYKCARANATGAF